MPIQVLNATGTPTTIATIDDLILLFGDAVANPAANTLLDRMKALGTFSDGVEGLITSTNASIATLNSYVDGLEALAAAATPAGELHIGEVGGNTAIVGGSFTRPANTTAYAIGQLVANSATAGSVTPIPCAAARKNAGTGVITGLRLSKSGASLTNASFRVHLFKTSPTTTVGDAGTFAGAVNGVAAVALGYVDITMDQAYSDGAKGFAVLQAKAYEAATGSQNIFALIEARGAYTPVSGETFTLALEVLRD